MPLLPQQMKPCQKFKAGLTGDQPGGAFFILDTIVKGNLWLSEHTNNCSDFVSSCLPFSPKHLTIFWKHNTSSSYLLSPSRGAIDSGGSFYATACHEAYITGNNVVNGAFSNDPDTFDAFVILHEYFHSLQYRFSSSDNPGGGHAAQDPIDPRLAYFEGIASYFAAAVIGTPLYSDHIRLHLPGASNPVYVAGLSFFLESEAIAYSVYESQSDPNCENCFTLDGLSFRTDIVKCRKDNPGSGCDVPNYVGEGHYREMSITRYFWDLQDDSPNEVLSVQGGTPSYDRVSDQFSNIWAVLTGPQFNNSNLNSQRGSGIHNKIYASLASNSHPSWSTLQESYAQASAAPFNRYEILPLKTTSCQEVTSTSTEADFRLHPRTPQSPQGDVLSISDTLSEDHLYLLLPVWGSSQVRITVKYKKNSSASINVPRLTARLARTYWSLDAVAPQDFFCPLITWDSSS